MIQASSSSFYTLFYILFTLGFVLQSREFIGAGLTPENLLSRWLQNTNSEEVQFIQHHIVRSSGTLIIHCSLPLIYLLGYCYFVLVVDNDFDSIEELIDVYPPFYYSIILASMLVISAFTLVYYWSLDSWKNHPIVKRLSYHALNNPWARLANDINDEFRRIDKITIRTSTLTRVVVTDNWIIKVGQWPWKFHLAHQSDVELKLVKSEHLQISSNNDGEVQYLSIRVDSRRNTTKPFNFRLKSTEYRDLESRLRSSIANIENIAIYKSVSERFVEVFRSHVEENPKHNEIDELEPCIGCMAVPANVKLIRRCDTNDTENSCVTCYCRPMWCLTCLGKWFAMRQNQDRPDTWLSSKCPCPTCRSKFCLLDVSLIEIST